MVDSTFSVFTATPNPFGPGQLGLSPVHGPEGSLAELAVEDDVFP